jgi:hypothetical protein
LSAVTVLQRRETQLPGVADEHHPGRDADDVTGRRVGREIGIGRPNLRQAVRALDSDRVGIASLLQQLFPLAPADPKLLGKIRVRTLGISRAHDVPA